MINKIKIQAIPNGPIKISELKSLSFCGKSLDTEGEVYLCRCGHSSKAPFCDGAHKKINFQTENKQKEKKKVQVWEGKRIKTFFDPQLCMHVYHCEPLKALRKQELRDKGNATAEEIAQVALSCPSGALRYEFLTALTKPEEVQEHQVEIMEGGEIRIHAPYEALNFELAPEQPEDRATLCRCGLSKNKPYCDGVHVKKKGFI